MGGNKPTTMRRHPILTWYAAKLLEFLSRPGARLMAGGVDNGAPGQRRPNYYATFVLDPDGNNIEAVFRGE
jgi:hypothetical protein